MASSNNQVTFSEREMQTMAFAWQCLDNNPNPNIQKLAALAGYTEGSCRNAWTAIRKKLNQLADGATLNNGANVAKATGGKRKAAPKNKKAATDDDEGEPPAKAAKRESGGAKGKKSKKENVKKEDEEHVMSGLEEDNDQKIEV